MRALGELLRNVGIPGVIVAVGSCNKEEVENISRCSRPLGAVSRLECCVFQGIPSDSEAECSVIVRHVVYVAAR